MVCKEKGASSAATTLAHLSDANTGEFKLPSQEVLARYHKELRGARDVVSDEPVSQSDKDTLLTDLEDIIEGNPRLSEARKNSIRQRIYKAESEPLNKQELLALQSLRENVAQTATGLNRALARGEDESQESHLAARAAYQQAIRDATADRTRKVPQGVEPPTINGQSLARVTAYGVYAAQCARGKAAPLGDSRCPSCGQFKASNHECPATLASTSETRFAGLNNGEDTQTVKNQSDPNAAEDELSLLRHQREEAETLKLARANGVSPAYEVMRKEGMPSDLALMQAVGIRDHQDHYIRSIEAGDTHSEFMHVIESGIDLNRYADIRSRGVPRLEILEAHMAGRQAIDYGHERKMGKSHDEAMAASLRKPPIPRAPVLSAERRKQLDDMIHDTRTDEERGYRDPVYPLDTREADLQEKERQWVAESQDRLRVALARRRAARLGTEED